MRVRAVHRYRERHLPAGVGVAIHRGYRSFRRRWVRRAGPLVSEGCLRSTTENVRADPALLIALIQLY